MRRNLTCDGWYMIRCCESLTIPMKQPNDLFSSIPSGVTDINLRLKGLTEKDQNILSLGLHLSFYDASRGVYIWKAYIIYDYCTII
ncbi:hypothetical protein QQP08_016077 [Theobroma cacao]|nr:hypothetical protein QQP08_016077 [Theobroma cacao]